MPTVLAWEGRNCPMAKALSITFFVRLTLTGGSIMMKVYHKINRTFPRDHRLTRIFMRKLTFLPSSCIKFSVAFKTFYNLIPIFLSCLWLIFFLTTLAPYTSGHTHLYLLTQNFAWISSLGRSSSCNMLGTHHYLLLSFYWLLEGKVETDFMCFTKSHKYLKKHRHN